MDVSTAGKANVNITIDLAQFTDAVTRMFKEAGTIVGTIYLAFWLLAIIAVFGGLGYCIKQSKQKGAIDRKADRVIARRRR